MSSTSFSSFNSVCKQFSVHKKKVIDTDMFGRIRHVLAEVSMDMELLSANNTNNMQETL